MRLLVVGVLFWGGLCVFGWLLLVWVLGGWGAAGPPRAGGRRPPCRGVARLWEYPIRVLRGFTASARVRRESRMRSALAGPRPPPPPGGGGGPRARPGGRGGGAPPGPARPPGASAGRAPPAPPPGRPPPGAPARGGGPGGGGGGGPVLTFAGAPLRPGQQLKLRTLGQVQ